MDSLDTHYVNEYESRVTTQMEQAETDLARAMELGDTQAAVEANKQDCSCQLRMIACLKQNAARATSNRLHAATAASSSTAAANA